MNWKRIIGWTAIGIVCFVALLALLATVLLHSNAFHQYLLATVQKKASSTLGAKVTLHDFKLDLSKLSLDLNGLAVHGSEPNPNAPLLSAQHVGANVKIVSLVQRTWYLNDIQVQHPVVHLYIDKDGNTNLPKMKSSGGKKTNIFDLAIRHVLVKDGEVYVNDRKTPLDADLRDLEFQSWYAAQNGGEYSGSLSYSHGHVKYGDYNPLPHDLNAKFVATRSGLELNPAVLRVGQSQVTLNATVKDYSSPEVDANYEVVLDGDEFRKALNNPSVPLGTIRLAGAAHYESVPGKTALETARIDGTLTSPALRIHTNSMNTEVREVAARYHLDGGNAELSDLRANLLGGQLNATGTIKDLSGKMDSQMHATLRGISLADAAAISNSSATKSVSLSGTLNADADASWTKGMKDLVASANATVQGNVTPKPKGIQNASATTVPVDGTFRAKYVGASKTVTLTDSFLRTAHTTINLNGTVSNRSSLQVRLNATDLHELETVADAFQTPSAGKPAQPLGLYGQATFNGTVRGTTSAPTLAGQLVATNLRVRNTAWRSLRTYVTASPSTISLQNGTLAAATQGNINFNLRAGLDKWSYKPANPINLDLRVSQVAVAELAKAASLSTPVAGQLNANVAIHGSQENPIGQGTIDLTSATVSSETIQSARIRFHGTGDVVQAKLNVRMPAGVTEGNVTYYPRQQRYDAALQAANIQLGKLKTISEKNLGLQGALTLNASGHGTVKSPEMEATLQIPQLRIKDQTISGIKLQTNVQNHEAAFVLDSQAVNSYIRAHGTVSLQGEFNTNAALDTSNIPLQPLVAAYMPAQASLLSGQTELHATVSGPLKNKSQLTAHVEIPVLKVNYSKGIELAAVSPIKADYRNGVLSLQPGQIRGTGTDLRFEGNMPLASKAPATLSVAGNLDLRIAQIFQPDLASSGQLRFDIRGSGSPGSPNIEGQVYLINASLMPVGAPLGLQNANGVLNVSNNRVDIRSFKGELGGGTITAQGGLQYRPSLHFDLAMAAKGVDFVYANGVRVGVETNLALTGTTQSSLLRGQVTINQISFTPDFDLSNFVSQATGESSPPPTQSFADNLKLSIAVQSSSQMNLVSRTVSVRGNANLRVQGTASDPVVTGRANLTGGDMIFMGNRYVVQGGTIDFVNPTRTEPVVNVSVNTDIEQYNINMRFQGPVDKLRTAYTSDPALPPVDIINLLAFGKTTEATQTNPATPGVLGAEGLLASGIASQVTGHIEKLAGISQLSIDPVLGGGQQNPGAHIAIKERVTSNLFVTFATDVTSTQRQQVQVQYQINPRWSVSANRDQNGGFGFDARVHKTW